jgi:hypothetical protein
VIELARYIALGDSVSIDLYPALDAGEIDVAVALSAILPSATSRRSRRVAALPQRRRPLARVGRRRSPFAAAAHRLRTSPPTARRRRRLRRQMSQLDETDEPTLVTLTVAGTTCSAPGRSRARRSLLDKIENDIADAHFLLAAAHETARRDVRYRDCLRPVRSSGVIPGVYEAAGPLPLDILDRFNAHVRTLATGTPRTLLADVHAHFLGHGVSAAESDQWYWRRSLIEPNAKGASQVRSVWLEALRIAGAIE